MSGRAGATLIVGHLKDIPCETSSLPDARAVRAEAARALRACEDPTSRHVDSVALQAVRCYGAYAAGAGRVQGVRPGAVVWMPSLKACALRTELRNISICFVTSGRCSMHRSTALSRGCASVLSDLGECRRAASAFLVRRPDTTPEAFEAHAQSVHARVASCGCRTQQV
jgi:hypothetical protein